MKYHKTQAAAAALREQLLACAKDAPALEYLVIEPLIADAQRIINMLSRINLATSEN